MQQVMSHRIEKDFLGEREIPEEVYYGIQTLRATENFPITGYKIQPELIRALGIVKKAAALANMETMGLPAESEQHPASVSAPF